MTQITPAPALAHVVAGTGPPVLLMHGGLGLDHTTLRPWLDPLADSYELIYYDHLANGRSRFSGDPEQLTHELWVETADGLRRQLGHEKLMVFGHSYGGILALEYTLRHPDRVLALIVSNCAPAFDYPEAVMANAQRKASSEAEFQAVVDVLSRPVANDAEAAAAFRRIHPLYFHDYDPGRHDRVLQDAEFRATALNRSMFACLPTFNVVGRLGEIAVPTLVLSGADDWIMPPEHAGARLAAGIPAAEHVIFDESGHWPFVEETDRYLAVVRQWLARSGANQED
jgi:proline iminopeptidase